jgi:hypothetical protein
MESIHPFHYFGHYKINIFCKSVMNLAGRKNVLDGPQVGHPWSRQCVLLNISQTYRPPRPVIGIALLFTFLLWRQTSVITISFAMS